MGTKRTLIDTNETSHPPYRGELRSNATRPVAERQAILDAKRDNGVAGVAINGEDINLT